MQNSRYAATKKALVGSIIVTQVGNNMKSHYLVFIAISIVLSSACSNEQEVVQEHSSSEQTLSEDNVFKGYVDTLDKAKGVEQMVEDAAQLRKQEMEDRGY